MNIKKIFHDKKAQLGIIEMKFFFIGLAAGILIAMLIIYLANKGIVIPFKMSFLC